MSAKSLLAFLGVLAVVGLLAFGVVAKGERQIEVGKTLPAAELPVLAAEAGSETASVADYRGRWVLLNVWASWCIPCEDEAPDLADFQRRYGGERFTVLGLNTQDGTADALEFEREFGLNYPSLRDGSGDYADELGTQGVPESVLLDPDGRVAFYYPGAVDEEILTERVAPLIREAGA